MTQQAERSGERLIDEAMAGNLRAVSELVEDGAGVNFANRYGVTPVMVAAQWNRPEVVSFLLESGANARAVENSSGRSVLMYACLSGNHEVVELVLKYGAQVNGKDRLGRTALMTAAATGNSAVVDMLLKGGAEVNARDTWGATALDFAVTSGHREVADLLEFQGAEGSIS